MPYRQLQINGRIYHWPKCPVVVVCLDGSSFAYIEHAIRVGAAPFLSSLVSRGNLLFAQAAMPTYTNPNNVSIITGVPPAWHGISGNCFYDPQSGQAVMMNDPSFLWCDTIPARFSAAGAKVLIITAKDKLRRLLGARLHGQCWSAEQEGVEPYSAALSEHVLRLGVECLRSDCPDILYLSTSDYVQHLYPPGSAEATAFYATVDSYLATIDRFGAVLVVTADHGMNAKTDGGNPCVIYLQEFLDDSFGPNAATVILPITDPYLRHHGALGSFAMVYLRDPAHSSSVTSALIRIAGVELVLNRDEACRRFELPVERVGDLIVCGDVRTVIGTRPQDHDLGALLHPLRSHGGLAEREVPMLVNRHLSHTCNSSLRNYDAFSVALNHLSISGD